MSTGRAKRYHSDSTTDVVNMNMIEIDPPGRVRSVVILLHGLGANGHDFEPLVHDWRLGEQIGVRFVLPHAPRRPVTLNGGTLMPAWYDIHDLDFNSTEDAEGICGAAEALAALVAREQARGLDSARIVLAGFSQGGALALHTALRYPQPLAGVLALSTYLPLRERLGGEVCADPRQLAIRIDHGEVDNVVPWAVGRRSAELLGELGFDVGFNTYPMGHSLCPQQIDSLRAWLVERLDES